MTNETEQRVRVPWFPMYREVRHLLQVWSGRPKKQITGLQTTLSGLRGTPQTPVNWTDPDTWILERLPNDDQDLAWAIWTKSGKTVNPRYTHGSWHLSQKYELLEDDTDGNLRLTRAGQNFINHERGETEAFLDEQEGIAKLLALVADNGPTRVSGILEEWIKHLKRYSSPFSSPSTFRTLQWRLK